MTFEQALKTDNLLFDGAIYSFLQKSGIAPEANLPLCNLTNPEIIKAGYAAYTLAGAEVITAASRGADAVTLEANGIEQSSYDICCAAAQNAKEGSGNAFTLMALAPNKHSGIDL